MELLTEAELELDATLADAARQFGRLPEFRPGEHAEFVAGMHRLQDLIMSRAATRAYPDRYTPFEDAA